MTKQRIFMNIRRTYAVFNAFVSTFGYPYIAILLFQAAIYSHAQGGPGSDFVTWVLAFIGLDCLALIVVGWYFSIQWWNKPMLSAAQ